MLATETRFRQGHFGPSLLDRTPALTTDNFQTTPIDDRAVTQLPLANVRAMPIMVEASNFGEKSTPSSVGMPDQGFLIANEQARALVFEIKAESLANDDTRRRERRLPAAGTRHRRCSEHVEP
jgi:hypothetical protein